MKFLAGLVLAFSLLTAPLAVAQDRSLHVSLIRLLASPESFDGRVVTAQGFLRVGHEPRHGVSVVLYLHEEDAKNLLASNSVLVLPSEQMLRDEEKIDRMYVILKGTVHVARAVNDPYGPIVIKDIQSCIPWSNPERPIGRQGNDKHKSK